MIVETREMLSLFIAGPSSGIDGKSMGDAGSLSDQSSLLSSNGFSLSNAGVSITLRDYSNGVNSGLH